MFHSERRNFYLQFSPLGYSKEHKTYIPRENSAGSSIIRGVDSWTYKIRKYKRSPKIQKSAFCTSQIGRQNLAVLVIQVRIQWLVKLAVAKCEKNISF